MVTFVPSFVSPELVEWDDKPKLLRDTTPEQLPTSFRVSFRSGADPAGLLSKLIATQGVDEVKTPDPMVRDWCRGT